MDSSNTSSHLGGTSNYTDPLQQIEAGGPVVYTMGLLTTILGAFGNGFVIYVYLRSDVLRNPALNTPTKTVLHLAITDLITMVMFGYSILSLMLDVKINFVCSLNSTLTLYMLFVTQCVLLVTNFDRYISIYHQEKHSKILTRRYLNILYTIAWLLPLPFHIPPLVGNSYVNKTGECIPRNLHPKWFLLTQSISFFLTMTLSVSLFIPIIIKAIKFHNKTAPAHFHGVNERTNRLKAKRRAIGYSFFIGTLTLVFLICNLPYSIIRFRLGLGFSGNTSAFLITFYIGVLNSVFNPFIYTYQKQLFRKEALKFIPCACLKRDSEARQLSRERQMGREQEFLPPAQQILQRNIAIQHDSEIEIVTLPEKQIPSHDTSGYPHPVDVMDKVEVKAGTSHCNTSSSSIALPDMIYVRPYDNISETSL